MRKGSRFAVLGISICLIILGCWTLYHYEVLPAGLRLPCIIYRTTGFCCPGCGATRACYAILHGEWKAATGYNPLLVVLLPLLGGYIALRSVDWAVTGGNHIDKHIPDKVLYVLLGVIFIYGVLRNLSLWPFCLLYP